MATNWKASSLDLWLGISHTLIEQCLHQKTHAAVTNAPLAEKKVSPNTENLWSAGFKFSPSLSSSHYWNIPLWIYLLPFLTMTALLNYSPFLYSVNCGAKKSNMSWFRFVLELRDSFLWVSWQNHVFLGQKCQVFPVHHADFFMKSDFSDSSVQQCSFIDTTMHIGLKVYIAPWCDVFTSLFSHACIGVRPMLEKLVMHSMIAIIDIIYTQVIYFSYKSCKLFYT